MLSFNIVEVEIEPELWWGLGTGSVWHNGSNADRGHAFCLLCHGIATARTLDIAIYTQCEQVDCAMRL